MSSLNQQFLEAKKKIEAMNHLTKFEQRDKIEQCRAICEGVLEANEKSRKVVEKKLEMKAMRKKAEAEVGL